MDSRDADSKVQQLVLGFETLSGEYQKLHWQHEALERKLATAREQYNELAKLCGQGRIPTPPLSLASSPERAQRKAEPEPSVTTILRRRNTSQVSFTRIQAAAEAAKPLKRARPKRPEPGVRIWSGPSADRAEPCSSRMPSISESPLEQDFTIEGVPSRLGCPFASMADKNLSSHAASVLSRLKSGSMSGAASQAGSPGRFDSRDNLSRRGSRRASFLDPIKAEICGLSDHQDEAADPAQLEHAAEPTSEKQDATEPGVCPIRFLDQHSPEEVATYFERHKHELPRSHETCVRRYQSNEQQIRELDEKYGNLVSMISGLGAKHKGMLPVDRDDEDEVAIEVELDPKEAEKVRKWASSVSAQPAGVELAEETDGADEDRQQRFERPLRDIRVGESPSRPWGITVPLKYLEKAGSEASSRPAQVSTPPIGSSPEVAPEADDKPEAKGKCPFGFDQSKSAAPAQGHETRGAPPFGTAEAPTKDAAGSHAKTAEPNIESSRIVFNGPVFIGYSAVDAAEFLRKSGLSG